MTFSRVRSKGRATSCDFCYIVKSGSTEHSNDPKASGYRRPYRWNSILIHRGGKPYALYTYTSYEVIPNSHTVTSWSFYSVCRNNYDLFCSLTTGNDKINFHLTGTYYYYYCCSEVSKTSLRNETRRNEMLNSNKEFEDPSVRLAAGRVRVWVRAFRYRYRLPGKSARNITCSLRTTLRVLRVRHDTTASGPSSITANDAFICKVHMRVHGAPGVARASSRRPK